MALGDRFPVDYDQYANSQRVRMAASVGAGIGGAVGAVVGFTILGGPVDSAVTLGTGAVTAGVGAVVGFLLAMGFAAALE